MDPALQSLAYRFLRFARHEAAGYSPLYARLSLAVAADPELLGLVLERAEGQPAPNLLFGAAAYLLEAEPGHPLAAWYPRLAPGAPAPVGDPGPQFRAFCLERRAALLELTATRRVQTNEVGRSSLLLPAFALAARRAAGRPLAVIDLGAAAGLHLLWDAYGYDYGSAGRWGDPQSPVQLACEARGARRPPLPDGTPEVAFRMGIDVHPLDPQDPDTARWLRALVWPEHTGRAETLARALERARASPPPVIAGDALEWLPEALGMAPADAHPVVTSSFALYQSGAERRGALEALLAAFGRNRPLTWIGLDGDGGVGAELVCVPHGPEGGAAARLARGHAHGLWIEWL